MNTLAAWGPTIVATLLAAFTYGRFSMKQDAHEERLDAHDDQFKDHGQHLQRIDIALVKLEEYSAVFALAVIRPHFDR